MKATDHSSAPAAEVMVLHCAAVCLEVAAEPPPHYLSANAMDVLEEVPEQCALAPKGHRLTVPYVTPKAIAQHTARVTTKSLMIELRRSERRSG